MRYIVFDSAEFTCPDRWDYSAASDKVALGEIQ